MMMMMMEKLDRYVFFLFLFHDNPGKFSEEKKGEKREGRGVFSGKEGKTFFFFYTVLQMILSSRNPMKFYYIK